jgi:MucR family transcriptional regulator, transcriptional regulator of exopolysaccharide biosynthesis
MHREKNVKPHDPGRATMTYANDPLLSHVANIASAYAGHNKLPDKALPGLIRSVYDALTSVGPEAMVAPVRASAPTAAKSPGGRTVFDDHLVCLDCGLHMKMLKRHLQTVHDMTPAEYRAKWKLNGDYPMVARQYAALRSTLAKESGLGKRQVPRGR